MIRVRFCIEWLCLDEGTLFYHGAGVVYKKDCFCFLGPSGTGKTTISGLVNEKGRWGEDSVGIRVQKEERTIACISTPFEANRDRHINLADRGVTIIEPVQGRLNRVRAVSTDSKIRLLLENNLLFLHLNNPLKTPEIATALRKAEIARILQLQYGIVKSAQFYSFAFNLRLTGERFIKKIIAYENSQQR